MQALDSIQPTPDDALPESIPWSHWIVLPEHPIVADIDRDLPDTTLEPGSVDWIRWTPSSLRTVVDLDLHRLASLLKPGGWLCVILDRRNAHRLQRRLLREGFHETRLFALLPSARRPRFVIPAEPDVLRGSLALLFDLRRPLLSLVFRWMMLHLPVGNLLLRLLPSRALVAKKGSS